MDYDSLEALPQQLLDEAVNLSNFYTKDIDYDEELDDPDWRYKPINNK